MLPMVEGFHKTFMAWLDQRLVAEIYLEANTDEQAQTIIGGWPVGMRQVTSWMPLMWFFVAASITPSLGLALTLTQTRTRSPTLNRYSVM
jgi:hypothetical protein